MMISVWWRGVEVCGEKEENLGFVIPFPSGLEKTPQVTPQVEDARVKKIIKFCQIPRSREDIQSFLELKDRENFRKIILKPLLEEKILKLTIPDKPKSPKQKYYS